MSMIDEELVVVQSIDHDEHLLTLFGHPESEVKDTQLGNSQLASKYQEPSRYDEKDIDRDYNSECQPNTQLIRKNKKRKVVTNLVAKARRERKNKLYI
jgi:hypothetical protein